MAAPAMMGNHFGIKGFGYYDPNRDLDLKLWLDLQEYIPMELKLMKDSTERVMKQLTEQKGSKTLLPEVRDSLRKRALIVKRLTDVLDEVVKRGPYHKFNPNWGVYKDFTRLHGFSFPKLDPNAPPWRTKELNSFTEMFRKLRREFDTETKRPLQRALNDGMELKKALDGSAEQYLARGKRKIDDFVNEIELQCDSLLPPKAEDLAAEGDEVLERIKRARTRLNEHSYSTPITSEELDALSKQIGDASEELERVERDMKSYDVSGGSIGGRLTGSRKMLSGPQVRKQTRVKFH